MNAAPREAPGLDALVHPLPLAALAVLVVNDHLLKPNVPSLLTGKLSGVAVLVLLPFVLLAAWDLARLVAPRLPRIGRRLAVASVAVTMAGYVAIEVVPVVGDAYRVGLGAAQWSAGAVLALVTAGPVPALAPVLLWRDVTDLLVVPAALVVLVVGPWSLREGRFPPA